MYTKKELYRLKEIGIILEKEFKDSFPHMIILETFKSIVEHFESIDILISKNKLDSSRSIYRTCLQSIANLDFILNDKEKIFVKAISYNFWYIQSINYKVVKLMENSETQTKQEMLDLYIKLLQSKFKTDEFEKFQHFLLNQRDLFFSTNNKRHWFNMFDIYVNEQSFISSQLGKETEYFYQISSEFTHGNSVVFNLDKINKHSLSSFDRTFLNHISLLFINTTAKLVKLSQNTKLLDEHLSVLSDYFDKSKLTNYLI
ncbi:DUF5677 domain-containing protein [Enterococcus gallinarum]|uniref:DUF5677 domain-containing protein n=1 Tax=Enterococcus gallinarum TaxID=1353 RepID=UPI003D6AC06F